MRPAIVLGLLALALALASPARAQPAPPAPTPTVTGPADEGAEGFRMASERLMAGDLAAARAAFEAVAAAAPAGPWAARALLEAGSAAERQGELAAARALFRRVLDEHAGSRSTRLAEVRLAALELAGGPGGRWDQVAAEHERLVRAAAADDPSARPALAALLDVSLGYPRWVPAAIWLADASMRAGDDLRAAIWYRRARIVAGSPDERFRAGMGEAWLWRRLGELDRARAGFLALEPPDAIAAGARAQALAGIERLRRQRTGAWVARMALVAACAAALITLRVRRRSWRGAVRGLWPPPFEVAYLLPLALAFTFVAETGNPLAARAAELILLGAIVIGWLSGAVMRAAGPRGGVPGRVAHLVIVLAATAAVVYLTVIREGLWDLLVETWRAGHDGR